MAFQIRFLEDDHRVLLTPGPGMRGPRLTDLVLQALADRPEIADWDWVNDLREPIEDSSNDDIVRIAAAFDAVSTVPTFTVFVTPDQNLSLWAQVMDHQFRQRRHLIADTPEAALALLDRKRA